jgi:hypothetical protein
MAVSRPGRARRHGARRRLVRRALLPRDPHRAVPAAPWRRLVVVGLGILALFVAPMIANAQQGDSVVVRWTAAGDDDRIGAAVGYDLRISEAPITAGNFESAVQIVGLPVPAEAGTRQQVTVRGLVQGTVYYFAIKSVDDAGNWSGISNVLRWDWILDTAPPATPQSVAAGKDEDRVRVTWTPSADADVLGYNVYRAPSAGGPWTLLTATPSLLPEYEDDEVPADAQQLWYQVSAVDVSGNESARSASASVTLAVATATRVTVEAVYPNPSRGTAPVAIPIVVPAGGGGSAVIDVVNAGGVRVRRIERVLGAGRQEVQWDGRNDAGRVVAPGVYRAWLIVGDTRTSIRLLRAP